MASFATENVQENAEKENFQGKASPVIVSRKWPQSGGPEEKAKKVFFDRLQVEVLEQPGALKQQDFKMAWDNFQLWMKSPAAKDTPVNLTRLEDVERLSKSALAVLKEPRERIKAAHLYIISSYHLTAYSSGQPNPEDRWLEVSCPAFKSKLFTQKVCLHARVNGSLSAFSRSWCSKCLTSWPRSRARGLPSEPSARPRDVSSISPHPAAPPAAAAALLYTPQLLCCHP